MTIPNLNRSERIAMLQDTEEAVRLAKDIISFLEVAAGNATVQSVVMALCFALTEVCKERLNAEGLVRATVDRSFQMGSLEKVEQTIKALKQGLHRD